MPHVSKNPVDDSPRELVPVSLDSPPAALLDFDVYLQPIATEAPILFHRGTHPLSVDDIERLARRGVRNLYVAVADQTAYRRHLRDEVCLNADVPPFERYKVLRDINEAVFEAVFRAGELEDMRQIAEDFGRPLASILGGNDLMLQELFSLMRHDTGTYAHSVSVATYCLILAKNLGIDSMEDLEAIATGALLHDIGKRHIQSGVLNCPGPLSDAQRELVEEHPTLGFKELFPREDVSWGQLMLVYQHHERVDGQGYPVGLTGEEIHPWARICAVADIFHALTSERPYRKPMPFEEALEYLDQRAGARVDKEIVECFNATMMPGCC